MAKRKKATGKAAAEAQSQSGVTPEVVKVQKNNNKEKKAIVPPKVDERKANLEKLKKEELALAAYAEEKNSKDKKHNFLTDFVTSIKKTLHVGDTTDAPKKKRETNKVAKPNIKAPVGKSMIDVFNSEPSIDKAVLDRLKGHTGLSRLFRRKKKEVPSVGGDLLTKINTTKRFSPTIKEGLSSPQVAQRTTEGLTNKPTGKYTKSYGKIIKDNCLTFFNVLLTVIAIALLIAEQYGDMVFVIIMIVNTLIGIVQEIRSKRTVDKLKLVTAPSSEVVRDGKKIKVSVDSLVIDDIACLETGTQISADSTIQEGTIEVNESMLTGESLPIKKTVGSTIYAGSFVVSGSAYAKVERVAEANWAINLQAKAKQFQKTKSELLRSLNAIIRVISLLVIPLSVCMFLVNYLNSDVTDWFEAFQRAIRLTAGSIVGMVPSGMFLLTSVALAVGIIRLSQRKTLVQDLYCFEMLARTNVLCLDKTGTLTDGSMDVDEVVVLNKSLDLNMVMGSFLNSFSTFNQTSAALATRYPLNTKLTPAATIPFSSSRKFSAVSFKKEGTYVLGAPEFVYKASDKDLMSVVEDRQKKGYRVIIMAHSDAYINDKGELDGSVLPVALFILVDHIRPEAYQTIKWFQENGVEAKIISGDNPYTAAEIARTCGVNDSEKCISLEGLALDQIDVIADKYSVFGRVSPEQKAALVKALKIKGRVVSMTGDGVNDILAMKQADCSIAMASGADAAKNIAQLVLLDSNFSSMPAVVMEGRRVVNNIQRSSALFLSKTLFTIALTIIFIFLGFASIGGYQFSYPLSPRALMLMEFIGIGAPSFFLALQPNGQQIKGHFLRNTFDKAIPGAIVLLLIVGTALFMNYRGLFSWAPDNTNVNVSPLLSLGMTFVGLALTAHLSRPFNAYRIALNIGLWLATIFILFIFNPHVIPHFNLFNIDIYTFKTPEIFTTFIFLFAAPVLISIFMTLFNSQRKTSNGSVDSTDR